MTFTVFAIALSIVLGALVVLPMIRARGQITDAHLSDVAVYKDQLKELDADVARGTVSQEDAESSRNEISRRLLAAADAAPGKTVAHDSRSSRIAALIIIAAFTIGTAGIYLVLGSPGTPDMPLASRSVAPDKLNQAEAEARAADIIAGQVREPDPRTAELIGQLREVLEGRPNDTEGLKLLSNSLASHGQYAEARQITDRVIDILGDAATPDDYATQAELMIFAAGGYVSEEAQQTLARVLQADLTNRRARYYSGLALAQNNRPRLAMNIWGALLDEGGPHEPWKEPIRAQVTALAESTGLPLPQSMLRGPTAEDVEGAADMSDADRTDMIRGMVENLAERLATEGGDPSEWARLITSLGVLGETERATAIYKEAQDTFAGNPDAIAAIDAAASQAGLPR